MYNGEIYFHNGSVWTFYGKESVLDVLHEIGVALEDHPNTLVDYIQISHHEVGNADASSGL